MLLDVREHVELALAAVAGALHIPMREVPARLAELDRRQAARRDVSLGRPQPTGSPSTCSRNGFSNVFNLKGGIDAWSTQLDSHVPRY